MTKASASSILTADAGCPGNQPEDAREANLALFRETPGCAGRLRKDGAERLYTLAGTRSRNDVGNRLYKPQANSSNRRAPERVEGIRRVSATTPSDDSAREKLRRRRAARKHQREESLRLERAVAIANSAKVKTPPAAVSVNEFRKATGASHATTHRWIKEGVIKSTKLGRRRFIAFSEISRIKGE